MFSNNRFKLRLLGKNKNLDQKPQLDSIVQNYLHTSVIIIISFMHNCMQRNVKINTLCIKDSVKYCILCDKVTMP